MPRASLALKVRRSSNKQLKQRAANAARCPWPVGTKANQMDREHPARQTADIYVAAETQEPVLKRSRGDQAGHERP
jgi:hypothetical protein